VVHQGLTHPQIQPGPRPANASPTVPRQPLANLLSASTTDIPVTSSGAPRARSRSGEARGWSLPPRRFYLTLIGVALVVSALSLLIPSTPSYDPWAWIVWGREIVHINLQTTGGPSWKPLPVILTTLFAPFGQAEPDLWLVVARAGAFAAVVMVFRLSFRLTRQIGSHLTSAVDDTDRFSAIGPPLLAGLIAALGLAFSGGFISDNALGYSEGLATAIILIAVERHLDGRPRQAFAIGFLAALDRPEIWLFWGPYGLYLWWKDPGARKLVLGLFVLIPILWFLPEYWGSGHFLRGVSRAQHPRSNSNAFAKCPFCAELVDSAWPTILLRIKVVAALLIGVVAFVGWRGWRRQGREALASPRARAQIAAAMAGLAGLAWFVVIAVMTQIGFSGNNRYLVIGSALVEVCGAVGWGWAAWQIGNRIGWISRRRRTGGDRTNTRAATLSALVIVGAAFALLPSWVGGSLIDIQRTHRSLVYQAHLRQDAARIVQEYGGAAKLLRCGTVMTEGFQVPLVAWTLGVHTLRVQGPPAEGDPGVAPNVIMQAAAHTHGKPLPIVHTWPDVHYRYAADVRTFKLFTNCNG
jgi:hypothetical protein